MKDDRSKAPRRARFPFSSVGRLARRWEGGWARFFSELNARGETRLEEIGRKLRQTEAWLRVADAAEKAERQRKRVRARWEHWGSEALGRAGIATDAQFENLKEEIQRLQWRIDRLSKKMQENQVDGEGAPEEESEFRSLA